MQPLPVVLSVVQEQRVVAVHKLGAGVCRVGASLDCDVVLEDAAVSRSHLELRLVPEGIHARDWKSRNGTFYLGQQLSEATLAPGCRLSLGATELWLDLDEDELASLGESARTSYGALLGESPSMRRLFALLERLEGSLVNVLIEGDTGTGKAMVARTLHQHSQLADRPYVELNCATIDRALLRSELFGYQAGAFSGVSGESIGAVGQADGGTLFLDEIGELPFDVQPLLLRVLESQSYTRLGETRPRPANVRIIAATERVLSQQVDEGQFRRDLLYRLMPVKLSLEPLRERPADVLLLARHLAQAMGLGQLPSSLLAQLAERQFSGNVRELKGALLAYGVSGRLPDVKPRIETDGALDALLRKTLDVTRPFAEQKRGPFGPHDPSLPRNVAHSEWL